MVTFNRVFCETYKKENVRSEAKNGLALNIGQKVTIIALVAKADAKIFMGNQMIEILKGDKVLVNEEDLHNKLTGITQMQTEGITDPFIVIDAPFIVGVG